MEAHVRTHTGARPYRCEVEGCDLSFTTGKFFGPMRMTVIKAICSRLSVSPTLAPVCYSTTCVINRLQSCNASLCICLLLMLSRYPCLCTSCFIPPGSALTRHLRCHTDEKRYCCEESGCGRKFARLEGLRLHMKAHRQDYEYEFYVISWSEGCDHVKYSLATNIITGITAVSER